VHLSVRASAPDGRRLNPRKADLHRWRETFAEKLRGWGIDAEATRQATRGVSRAYDPLWRVKAGAEGRLRTESRPFNPITTHKTSWSAALEAWACIAKALNGSDRSEDRALARDIDRFVCASPFAREFARTHQRAGVVQERSVPDGARTTTQRPAPDIDPGR
jgi:hypothetical protein